MTARTALLQGVRLLEEGQVTGLLEHLEARAGDGLVNPPRGAGRHVGVEAAGEDEHRHLEARQHRSHVDAREVLRDVEGIGFVDFDDKDVVRHELVARIVRAYDRHERSQE